jgi:AraC-like DNA-binding protein
MSPRRTPTAPGTATRPARPAASTISATGRIHFWQGGVLWLGRGQGRTDWHAHHAHQLALALDGEIRFRTERDAAWGVYQGALVSSHSPHQFEIDGTGIAHFFVEPESRAGRGLVARFGRDGVHPLPDDIAAAAARMLRDALDAGLDGASTIAAATQALGLLCNSPVESGTELDPRLLKALAYIRANMRDALTLPGVAATVHLSESRFRHLFVAETGSSFRAYLLWLRINVAIESVMAGATWTAAAHEAGFADSAHLTRTHRRMFGIEPSSILRT